MLPRGLEELPDRPGAVGVRPGGLITGLLILLGALGVLGGIPLFFVEANDGAATATLWPVGLLFVALGLLCLAVLWLVTRGPKYVFDDTGVHSRAVFGRYTVHWDHIEEVQPIRGAVWVTAPGGIHTASGRLTRKKTLGFNTRGLRCGSGTFAAYLNARLANGGRALH